MTLTNSPLTFSPADPSLEDPSQLPDHTQLPESDGRFVKNLQEHPQSLLLTSSITPVLDQLHPDGQYAIGQDSGIYWRLADPPERGAVAPDWFYVPNVSPLLEGKRRRSYVLWKEQEIPVIAIEFVSDDGSEERDATPLRQGQASEAGKFWIYEQVIQIPFYAIYEVEQASVEVYELIRGRYRRCEANQRGHYPIPPLQVELGIWEGEYMHQWLPWLRWWDPEGNLLLTGEERAEQEKQRADQANLRAEQANLRADYEKERAEQANLRLEQLAARLRALGVDPNTIGMEDL